MDFDTLKNYCNSKPGAEETFPFDLETLVMKVGGKMFALIGLNDEPLRINLKGDPFYNDDLRMQYKSVIPGYHMNKLHWNTVILDGDVPDEVICSMIDESYDLVFSKLTKRIREDIQKNK